MVKRYTIEDVRPKVQKLILLSCFFFIFITSHAMSLYNAIHYYEGGDLLKAKEQIDLAILNENKNTSAKAWYYRGLIHLDIAGSQKIEFESITDSAIKIAAFSFEKIRQYDKPNGKYIKLSESKIYPLWILAVNKGVSIKNVNEKSAYEYYVIAHRLLPDSIAPLQYGIDLAYKKENYSKLKYFYSELAKVSLNYEWFYNWAWILIHKDRDYLRALQVIQQGRTLFPNNGKLLEEEINLYIAMNRLEEARQKTEQEINLHPDHSLYYLNLGKIYAKSGDDTKALESYVAGWKLDSSGFETNFNLGIYYYNKGDKLLKQLNQMELGRYRKEGKCIEKEIARFMYEAIRYLKRSEQIKRMEVYASRHEDIDRILKDITKKLEMNKSIRI
jgi:tetratricopeptide (TPR) repeat protein